jgi:hypothetical protein
MANINETNLFAACSCSSISKLGVITLIVSLCFINISLATQYQVYPLDIVLFEGTPFTFYFSDSSLLVKVADTSSQILSLNGCRFVDGFEVCVDEYYANSCLMSDKASDCKINQQTLQPYPVAKVTIELNKPVIEPLVTVSPSTVTFKESATVTLSVTNTGPIVAKQAKAVFQVPVGSQIRQSSKIQYSNITLFIGDISSSKKDISFQLIPSQTGTINGTIYYSYENPAGMQSGQKNLSSLTITLTTPVVTAGSIDNKSTGLVYVNVTLNNTLSSKLDQVRVTLNVSELYDAGSFSVQGTNLTWVGPLDKAQKLFFVTRPSQSVSYTAYVTSTSQDLQALSTVSLGTYTKPSDLVIASDIEMLVAQQSEIIPSGVATYVQILANNLLDIPVKNITATVSGQYVQARTGILEQLIAGVGKEVVLATVFPPPVENKTLLNITVSGSYYSPNIKTFSINKTVWVYPYKDIFLQEILAQKITDNQTRVDVFVTNVLPFHKLNQVYVSHTYAKTAKQTTVAHIEPKERKLVLSYFVNPLQEELCSFILAFQSFSYSGLVNVSNPSVIMQSNISSVILNVVSQQQVSNTTLSQSAQPTPQGTSATANDTNSVGGGIQVLTNISQNSTDLSNTDSNKPRSATSASNASTAPPLIALLFKPWFIVLVTVVIGIMFIVGSFHKQGQMSLELIMLFAFIMLLLLPGVYFVFQASSTSSFQINAQRLSAIGNQVVDRVDFASSLGQGSRVPLEYSLPHGLLYMSMMPVNGVGTTGNELYMNYSQGPLISQLVFFSTYQFRVGNCTHALNLTNASYVSGKQTLWFENCGLFISVFSN